MKSIRSILVTKRDLIKARRIANFIKRSRYLLDLTEDSTGLTKIVMSDGKCLARPQLKKAYEDNKRMLRNLLPKKVLYGRDARVYINGQLVGKINSFTIEHNLDEIIDD